VVQQRVTAGFSVLAEDQRNLYAPNNPPERLGITRHRRAARSQVIEVIEVIEVTLEELSTSGLEVGLNLLANQIVTFST
jgi:hypothetical protein